MGGWNSSRWHDHTRKLTVEECSKLKVGDFPKSMLVERCEKGELVYYNESYPSIYSRLMARRVMDKLYPETAANRAEGREKRDKSLGQAFRVTRTACNYGGWRYWLLCPRCKRRCAVLYSRGYPYYACRKCHDLTYRSTQDARRPVGYGALAMYLTRSKLIEDKLFKVKRWRKRARRLDAQLDRLHARLGWAWYRYATPLFAETGLPLELE
jgi:hypothetical protein